ncbi:MAG: nitroreductase [Candidatus Lokiarchaeota archaeon]|nr:nitroreductase [Candidatus Lokiarchaeota archaeon]MBD3199363.1 nitroreductase [Candidatus Lokiarchaeota archaeon]
MDFEKVVYKRRTIRRFSQEPISLDILKKLIDYARLAPMGSNKQSLSFIIVKESEIVQKVFPLVRWAASLPIKERTPEKDRRPTAYILVLQDKTIKEHADFDVGAAVENILLGAVNHGLGACWMGSINRKELKALFHVPDQFEITHVLSLGFPDEKSTVEKYVDSFHYWKDKEGKMHVPKKQLDAVIFKIT